MTYGHSGSFSKAIFQCTLSFALAYILVYTIYSLLGHLANSGFALGQGNSIWSHAVIDPTVASLGLGTFFLLIPKDRGKAIFAGVIAFLSSLAIFRLWNWFLPLNKLLTFDPKIFLLFFPLHEAVVGLFIGAIIGCIHASRGKLGWYALAGSIGMTVGFLIMDIAGKKILAFSPYASDIGSLIIGSPWYYLYFIFPAMIQGLALGISFGFAEMINIFLLILYKCSILEYD